MDISIGDIYTFIVTYRWWIAAIVPFVIAFFVLRARGCRAHRTLYGHARACTRCVGEAGKRPHHLPGSGDDAVLRCCQGLVEILLNGSKPLVTLPILAYHSHG